MGKTADTERREGDCMTIVHLHEDDFYKLLECVDELEQLKRKQYRDIQGFNNYLRSLCADLNETEDQE